ncbi:MAG: molecular chaperone HtpG [Lachnospiraceae bacterium]|nr:molecular chaperone HtpG [Lachnospiraceae bacterium]
MAKKGNLSINSENMLPIIKKWLYSDHDIFVREQVANACDAITKLKKLEGVGEYKPETDPDYRVDVIVNPDDHTLKFIDNGIGMTEEEVEKYITQIAFSGASEFLKKYEGKTDKDQIIGHFGLGFYSAFMVADEVHIDTLSYLEGAKPVHWESDGESEYEIGEGNRTKTGTEITLFLNDDCLEFCNEYRIREILTKYCSFMPTPIFLADASEGAAKREAEEDERRNVRNAKNKEDAVKKACEDAKKDAPEGCPEEEQNRLADEAAKKAEEEFKPEVKPIPEPINDIHPLWTKRASECSDEEYKSFYRNVFNDYKEPLFYIHLNTEYPFNLRGILYFPKINTEYDALESQIKLYNNQVFIADNIKEVVPEFLMTMKGVIDCPDLPLNVSRSALQNDGTVKKICDYISKKVADKLSGMCKTDRENYEKYWDDISPFIKYGCIKDTKFADKMMDYMLFKDIEGKYLTLKEYAEKNAISLEEEKKEEGAEAAEAAEAAEEKVEEADKPKSTVFYVTDEVQQAQYIAMFRKEGKDAVILKENIDNPFISQLEQRNERLKFARIDAELAEDFVGGGEVSGEDAERLTESFRKNLNREKLTVEAKYMKDDEIAAIVTLSEETRRMQDMMKMYGMGNDPSMLGGGETLVLNVNHPLVKYILTNGEAEMVPIIEKQLYDLAMLSHKPLTQEEMTAFVKRSNEIMLMLAR